MNTFLASALSLLATVEEIGKFEHLGMRFRGEYTDLSPGRILGLLAIPFSIFLLFAGLKWFGKLFDPKPEQRSPRRLFRELTDAFDMGAGERRLCHEVANAAGLATPAELFLRPDLKERVAERDRGLAERIFRLDD